LRKLGAGYLRKPVCLGGLIRKTLGMEWWTKFHQKGGPCMLLRLFCGHYVIPTRVYWESSLGKDREQEQEKKSVLENPDVVQSTAHNRKRLGSADTQKELFLF